MTTRPLGLTPYPAPEPVMAAIRAAKQSLNLPFQVIPTAAVPGYQGRALALRGVPDFAGDYALVSDWRDPEKLAAAIKWVLDEDEPIERGFTFDDWMHMHLGAVRVHMTAGEQYEFDNSTDVHRWEF